MSSNDLSTSAVVLAAGQSRRMGGSTSKVLLDLDAETVLEHSVRVFSRLDAVKEIVVVIAPQDRADYEGDLGERLKRLGVTKIVPGGAERHDSTVAGLAACNPENHLVLIHDGARPFPPSKAVKEAIEKAGLMGGAILATPLHDTVKKVDDEQVIIGTLPREQLYRAQTPQVFQQKLFKEALEQAGAAGMTAPTDDALILEARGHTVCVIDGGPSNLKITTPDDLRMARALLALKKKEGSNP